MVSKKNTEKQPRNKIGHYNLRSKEAPHTLGEMQENIRLLIRKVDPLATPKQKTQRNFGKIAMEKITSMSSKLQNTPSDNMNTCPT